MKKYFFLLIIYLLLNNSKSYSQIFWGLDVTKFDSTQFLLKESDILFRFYSTDYKPFDTLNVIVQTSKFFDYGFRYSFDKTDPTKEFFDNIYNSLVERFGVEIRRLDNDSTGEILRVWLINKNIVEIVYPQIVRGRGKILSVQIGEAHKEYITNYILPLFKEIKLKE